MVNCPYNIQFVFIMECEMLVHLQSVLVILLPLFVGFGFKLPQFMLKILDKLLMILVYVILCLIGMGFAKTPNLSNELSKVATYAIGLFICLAVCNCVVMIWFDRMFFRQHHPFEVNQIKRQKIGVADSVKQLMILFVGILLGRMLPEHHLSSEKLSFYALMLLIFVVGLQMRGYGIALRQVFLNRHGLWLSVWFMVSCAVAGLLFALVLPDVSWTKGLALSSGYGWYSLSGIVMTQAYGATWGSVALLNDLLREFAVLVFIPILMRRYPSTAIGIGGAASLDFMLPLIQKSGGLLAVPVAISFGFIVNVVAPFLMVFFSAFSS